jgi:hypothetical protein
MTGIAARQLILRSMCRGMSPVRTSVALLGCRGKRARNLSASGATCRALLQDGALLEAYQSEADFLLGLALDNLSSVVDQYRADYPTTNSTAAATLCAPALIMRS